MTFSFLFTVCGLCFMWQFTCACACAATYFPALYIAMSSFTRCTEQHPCDSAKHSITTDHKAYRLCRTRFRTQKTEQLGVSYYSLWINLLDASWVHGFFRWIGLSSQRKTSIAAFPIRFQWGPLWSSGGGFPSVETDSSRNWICALFYFLIVTCSGC